MIYFRACYDYQLGTQLKRVYQMAFHLRPPLMSHTQPKIFAVESS